MAYAAGLLQQPATLAGQKHAKCVLTDETQQQNMVADKVSVMTSMGDHCELVKWLM